MGLASALLGRRGTGCLPDPKDERDFLLPALIGAAPIPSSAGARHPSTVPRYQNGTESCTGFALAIMLREALLAHGVECDELSALFPYSLGRAEWGGERVDRGSFLRTTCRATQRYGCATEAAWPFSRLRVNRQPSWGAFRSAHPTMRRLAFYRIPSGDGAPNAICRALASKYTVVGGWLINRGFQENGGSYTIDVQEPPYVGGHAIGIDEYYSDGKFFGTVGSYGRKWKREGFAELTREFVERAFDLWALKVSE